MTEDLQQLCQLVSRWRLEASVADMTGDEPRLALFSRVASELDLLVAARLATDDAALVKGAEQGNGAYAPSAPAEAFDAEPIADLAARGAGQGEAVVWGLRDPRTGKVHVPCYASERTARVEAQRRSDNFVPREAIPLFASPVGTGGWKPERETLAKKLAELKGHRELEAKIVLEGGISVPVWKCYLKDADAILALPAAPYQPPEGRALVPHEITMAMRHATWKNDYLDAGATEAEAAVMAARREADPVEVEGANASYRAMIAAAPSLGEG
jgi:hypothetical protein